MRRNMMILIVCVIAVMLQAHDAVSQQTGGGVYVNPTIGGYIFDSGQDINSDPAYGLAVGYNLTDRISAQGVFNYVRTDVKSHTSDEGVKAYVYRIEGLYNLMMDKTVYPYLAVGAGAIDLNYENSDDDTDFLVDYGAGIKFFITESLAATMGVRHIISFDDTNNNLIYTAGLSYLFGAAKKEPPKPADSDGDGVTDEMDRCPGTPAGVKVDTNGCPLDTDGDGVYDYQDECPGTPSGVKVDSKGCPLDTDGDGVYDYRDECPDTPSGAPVDPRGCPLDTDGDGVYDYMDRCPGTPAGIKVDAAGCPVPIKEKVTIRLHVEFETNSDVVRNIYHEDIMKVADFMKAYPDTTVVIEGHTDSRGSEEYNLDLSRRRAENVMKHMIEYGIDPSRLRAVGYGESRPIADNSTPEGRQKNRRVEAVITTEVIK